ncbi:protein terminal ear1-like [Rosa chinensis]|nr:protein terminal ear1-like [Rosa chinensis]
MFLQPPRQPYLIPQPFFPSHFYYQNYDQVLQPYFVNPSQTQIYVCDPFIYHVFPTYYFQRPPNPPINPRVLPQPRRNTRLKPKRNIAATTSGVRKWVPKRRDEQASTSVRTRNVREGSSVIPFPTSPYQQITSTTTTIMIKNIPNQFGRSDLLSMLKDHCLDENLNAVLRSEPKEKSEFDFLYLPMDFKKFWEKERISNLGYAFVNFTSSSAALRFYKQYHKFEWPVPKNKKICEVTCAKTQGKEALTKKFKNKIFWCHSNEYLPVILAPPCDGVKNSGLVMVGKLAGQPKILKKK